MKLKVNAKEMEIEEGTTITALLQIRGINPASVIIEYNYEIPEREKWQDISLKDGDNLEIVKFIGGG